MAVSTYYFDGHNGITDPDSAWTNEAYVFDGNPDTSTYGTSGSSSSNYLLGKGTTAPSSGGIITQVRAKIIGTNTTWVTLDEPTGGWTWGAVSELEVRVWNKDVSKWETYANASVFAQNGELPPLLLGTTVRTSILVSGIEIEVTYTESTTPTVGVKYPLPPFRRS